MILLIAKFGITISLFMVANALFYPNKFSLIIAILGYIIALISAVIYGLCRTNETLQESITVNDLESSYELVSKNTSDLKPKTFNLQPRKSNIVSTIQALGKEKGIGDMDLIFKISFADESNDFDTFRECSWIKRIEDETYTKDDIAGYQ